MIIEPSLVNPLAKVVEFVPPDPFIVSTPAEPCEKAVFIAEVPAVVRSALLVSVPPPDQALLAHQTEPSCRRAAPPIVNDFDDAVNVASDESSVKSWSVRLPLSVTVYADPLASIVAMSEAPSGIPSGFHAAESLQFPEAGSSQENVAAPVVVGIRQMHSNAAVTALYDTRP